MQVIKCLLRRVLSLNNLFLFFKYILFLLIFNIIFGVIMIQVQTYLNVADNSGAQKLMCIQILGSNRKYANVGDVIVVVVKVSNMN